MNQTIGKIENERKAIAACRFKENNAKERRQKILIKEGKREND